MKLLCPACKKIVNRDMRTQLKPKYRSWCEAKQKFVTLKPVSRKRPARKGEG